ncbi:Inactive ubiquitin carboxyl-terminal hydrolase MINDY-4B, partial [Nibea albiflora]
MDRQVFGPLHHDGPVSVWTGSSLWTGECLDRFIMMDRRVFGPVHHDGPRLLDVGKDEDLEEAPPPCRTLPQLCSIPRRLVISPGLGGMPVTPKLTENLRRILFGGTFHVFNYEWRKSFFQFREPDSELSYALEADRGGARAVQMVVQARIIKYLLFIRQSGSGGRVLHSLCEVGQRDQEKALVAALSDSLWLAGQEVSATVTLVTEEYCITPHLDYKLDNFTERVQYTVRTKQNKLNKQNQTEQNHPTMFQLQLFTFNNKDNLRRFLLDHVQCFKEEGSHGVILFLYSLILSRTVDRLKDDLDSTTSHLLYLSWETLCVVRWVACLKTPRFPVWLCCINNSYSVAFSVNRSLLSDWKMEHQFQLNYYNGQNSQNTTARLTVDTHSHHWEALSSDSDGDLEKRFPSLEMTIRTKWEGAAI